MDSIDSYSPVASTGHTLTVTSHYDLHVVGQHGVLCEDKR